MNLIEFTTGSIWTFFLLLARFGTTILILPALGELYVSPRIRIVLAIFMAMVMYPVALPLMPALPSSPIGMMLMMAAEIFCGFFLGLVMKLLLTVMHMMGAIVSAQSGLSSAMLFDPSQGEQSTVISTFLASVITVLIFVSNLHHLWLKGLAQSLHYLPLGKFWLIGDQAEYMTHLLGDVFRIAMMLAAPQILIGLVLFGGAGVLARLMPSMQIFFILVPLQILLALGLLMVTLTGLLLWYADYLQDVMTHFGWF
jgi:flagellar biosynthetic protein FliR